MSLTKETSIWCDAPNCHTFIGPDPRHARELRKGARSRGLTRVGALDFCPEHAVGDRVDILQFNDDLGTQDAPFLSIKMFRELIFPHYKRGLDWIHANTSMKVFMHNDGAIFDFLPTLIEMGVDILNPVQTTAKGMDPVELKRQFGDQIVFWGGSCDCQNTLPFGTPQQVAREVEESIRILSPNGGFVLASVHNIQAEVPPANVAALFETALAMGGY